MASSVLFSPSGTFTDVAQRRLKRVPQLTRIKHKVEGTKLADGSLLKSVSGKLALQTIFGCYSGVLHIQSLSEQTQLVQSFFSRVLPQLVCGVNLGVGFILCAKYQRNLISLLFLCKTIKYPLKDWTCAFASGV